MPEALSLTTFNLNNLQQPGRPAHHDVCYSEKEYQSKVSWTAEVLSQLHSDIIGFQELWYPQCLHDVFAAAGTLDNYQLICAESRQDHAVALAVHRSLTVDSVQWISGFPPALVLRKRPPADAASIDYAVDVSIDHFSHPVLSIELTPYRGRKLQIFVVHLKSKLPIVLDAVEAGNDAVKAQAPVIGAFLTEVRRQAEAAALRVLVNQTMQAENKAVVVMGDFNDVESSVTMELLRGRAPYHLTPAQCLSGPSGDLNYQTYIHEKTPLALDHILVSPQFTADSIYRHWRLKKLELINGHLKKLSPTVSDHAVVTARFDAIPIE